MARVKNSIIAERRLRMLGLIYERGGGAGGCVASTKELAQVLGLTTMQMRGLMKSLSEGGLVRVVGRTYPNGGTAENAYFVTPAGAEALKRGNAAGCRPRPRQADAVRG